MYGNLNLFSSLSSMPTYVRFSANYTKYATVKFSKKKAWPKQKAVDLRYVQVPCTGELLELVTTVASACWIDQGSVCTKQQEHASR